MACPCPATADTLLFSDDFARPDSDTVGNGWSVSEGTGDVDIAGGRLFFANTGDESNRPLAGHAFTRTDSGLLRWSFTFDWTRSGSEGTYRLFLQLGDSHSMSLPAAGSAPDGGVAVNLVWTAIGGAHETLGYVLDGAYTPLTSVSGPTAIEVVADLDAQSYAVFVDGSPLLCGLPFDDAAAIDTLRFVSDLVNDANFAGRSFDDVVVEALDAGPAGGWPPVARDQSVTTDENLAVAITLEAGDCDGSDLDFMIVDGPANGDLTGLPPEVTYTPDPGFAGQDSFTFKANDGESDSNIATVTLLVSGDQGQLIDIADYTNSSGGYTILWHKARFEDLTIAGDGVEDIPFGLAHPSGYEPSAAARYPLVLYLHGAGARGDDNQMLDRATAKFFAQSAREYPGRWNAFVLAPQCPGGSRWVESDWGDGPYEQDDGTYGEYMHLAENLVYYLTNPIYNGALLGVLGLDADDIDLTRIYVVGDSMGAYGTWDIVARQPGLFAGAISSGGSGPRNRLDQLRQTPFWAIHGENDTTVPNALPIDDPLYGAGSLGMLGLLNPAFDGVTATADIYVDDPFTATDDPPGTWRAFIYSEFTGMGHNPPAANWTQIPTPGVREWLFAQALAPINNCPGDFEPDGDVDGEDIAGYIDDRDRFSLEDLAARFGRDQCP